MAVVPLQRLPWFTAELVQQLQPFDSALLALRTFFDRTATAQELALDPEDATGPVVVVDRMTGEYEIVAAQQASGGGEAPGAVYTSPTHG